MPALATTKSGLLTGVLALAFVVLLGLAMRTFGQEPDSLGESPSMAHGFQEPRSLEELVVLSGNQPQGPDLVVVGVFSGPQREVKQQVEPPPSVPTVEVAPGVFVPAPTPAAPTTTYFTLTIEDVVIGDASQGDELPVVYGVPANLSGQLVGGWQVPSEGERWLVLLNRLPRPDGTIAYAVPPYWQFDLATAQPRFAGDVSPEVSGLLDAADSQEDLERLIEDALRFQPSEDS